MILAITQILIALTYLYLLRWHPVSYIWSALYITFATPLVGVATTGVVGIISPESIVVSLVLLILMPIPLIYNRLCELNRSKI